MTANGNVLPWGLAGAVPPDATVAWGARLIVTQDGGVDLVHDRQGCAGEGRAAFLELLSAQFPPGAMTGKISELLKGYRMDTRKEELIGLFSSDQITVVANTNGSGGYCYVAAWLR